MNDLPALTRPLQPVLLGEQVTQRIREAIVTMCFQPGQRITERELIDWTGVSRATVRESLRQLSSEGLVTIVPQRGAVVTAPTPAEADEICEIRALLEARAVRQFVENATAAEREELRARFHAIEQIVAASDDIWAMLAAKRHFYDVLLAGSHNSIIEGIILALQARINVLRAASMSQRGRPERSVEELRQLVQWIDAGDADRAAEACAAHVRSARSTSRDASAASGSPRGREAAPD